MSANSSLSWICQNLLEEYLSSVGPLSALSCKRVLIRVCKGLGWLHSRKSYVHLQVRPDNIIVDPATHRTWLMGVGESFLRKRMDMVDVSLIDRTVGYASPELISALPVTGKSDVFSLGSLMYRCGTGQNVWQGKEGTEILQLLLSDQRPSLTGIDSEIASVISLCWKSEPNGKDKQTMLFVFLIVDCLLQIVLVWPIWSRCCLPVSMSQPQLLTLDVSIMCNKSIISTLTPPPTTTTTTIRHHQPVLIEVHRRVLEEPKCSNRCKL
jgi:serine/threonine protein kinase